MERGNDHRVRIAMLALAGNAVGSWLFFAIGVSPATLLAAVTFGWAAVRSSLGRAAAWAMAGTMTVKRYLLPIMMAVAAGQLGGCGRQLQYAVHFFKASGSGKEVPIISWRQGDSIPAALPAKPPKAPTSVSFGPSSGATVALPSDAAVTPSATPR